MAMDDDARAGRLHVGIGGPVGSGKTALVEALCRALDDAVDLAAVTNDIYTREDAEFLIRRAVLPPDRVHGVETGGGPPPPARPGGARHPAPPSALPPAPPPPPPLLS